MSPVSNGSSSSSTRSNNQPVKFSSLKNPPRANVLQPPALLSLLFLSFTCLLFICFRHVGWIVVLRKRIRDLLCQQDLIKRIQSGFRPLKFLRRASNDRSLGQIRLSDDADDHADLNKLDRRLQTRHMRVTPSNNNNDEDEENADFHEEQDGSGLGLIQPNSNLVEITRRLDREDTYRDYYSNQFDDHSQSENFYDDVDDDEVLPEVTK